MAMAARPSPRGNSISASGSSISCGFDSTQVVTERPGLMVSNWVPDAPIMGHLQHTPAVSMGASLLPNVPNGSWLLGSHSRVSSGMLTGQFMRRLRSILNGVPCLGFVFTSIHISFVGCLWAMTTYLRGSPCRSRRNICF